MYGFPLKEVNSETMRNLTQKWLLKIVDEVVKNLRDEKLKKYNRHVSLGDLIADRQETASFYGFGEGTTCYDNVLILGDVQIGKNTWIGPNVILDGSGGLQIGDHVSISAGVQIYTHSSVDQSRTSGLAPIQRQSTSIGNGVYIGPNSILQMGVKIGDGATIGALSLVNQDIPAGEKVFGAPIRIAPNVT